MKHVVVDLEMNCIDKAYKSERRYCRMEIIQIGAVLLDEEYKEIGSFSTLVKPQLNYEIGQKYVDLTGITWDMVKGAPVFKEAIHSFFQWIQCIQDEVEVLAWSENDLNQIIHEAYIKDYIFLEKEEDILDQWFDFQEEFGHTLFLDGRCSLQKAIEKSGLTFEGKQHDALFDAKNTANLLALMRDEKRCMDIYGSVVSWSRVDKCTLGDLFDFSQFL